jgi:hypothetical protein
MGNAEIIERARARLLLNYKQQPLVARQGWS